MLVVDDNIDMLMMLASALRARGYLVESAYTWPEGLHFAQRWRPEVILLDIGLPGMDGYEVARRLRAGADGEDRRADRYDGRIVALTGYGRESDVARALEAGCDAHLTKPYDFDELERVILSAVREGSRGRADPGR